MQALGFLFSPSGRLRPQPFIYAVLAVYVAGAASQWLTLPDVIARGGIWLFAAIQAILIWIWFSLHAQRLRDAGRPTGLAAGVSVLYALSIVLLVMIAAAFSGTAASEASIPNAPSALVVILLLSIVATLRVGSEHDVTSLMVAAFTLLAFVPIALAVSLTLWAVTRPHDEKRQA